MTDNNVIIDVKGLYKTFDKKKMILQGITCQIKRGEKIVIIGPSGGGKSTFLRILTGELEPTNGDVVITPGERLSVLKQNHFEFDECDVIRTVLLGNKKLCDILDAKEELYADGSFYITDCTVNGNAVDYTYGEKQYVQVYKPQYYGDWSFSGIVGTTAAPVNPSTVAPEGKNFYLGYDVTDGVVSIGYVCFVRNETEYCLKGLDAEAFSKNTEVLI